MTEVMIIYIDDKLKKRFKGLCGIEGTNMSQLVCQLVEDYIEEKIKED